MSTAGGGHRQGRRVTAAGVLDPEVPQPET
jgi:hypothetical protein